MLEDQSQVSHEVASKSILVASLNYKVYWRWHAKELLANELHAALELYSIAVLLVVGPDCQVKTVSAIEIHSCRVCSLFKQKVDCLSMSIVGCKMQWSSLKFIIKTI